VQANAVPLRLAADDPGVVMVLHDVTELRRLEQVRTEFVANVSHELRTPLTAIHGYLETLLSGALEDRDHARRFLEIVFRHTERLGRLLNDLTDLSNIELGRVILKIEPTRVDEVVESVLAIIKPRAEAGSVTLTADLAGPLRAQADRDRLAQILINLVDNAVKYTPGGVDWTALSTRLMRIWARRSRSACTVSGPGRSAVSVTPPTSARGLMMASTDSTTSPTRVGSIFKMTRPSSMLERSVRSLSSRPSRSV